MSLQKELEKEILTCEARIAHAKALLSENAEQEDPAVVVPIRRGRKPKAKRGSVQGRVMTPAGRAAISRAAKKRWSAYRKAKRA